MAMKANIFYARPVVLGNSSGTSNFRTNKPEGQRIPVKKQTRFADLENTEPPPRPPPPRPSRPPKQGEVTRIAHTEREVKRRLPTAPTNSVSYAPTYATPEPKPLTRLNVTSHERLWMKDAEEEENGPTNILSPPMKYITPESTEEMVRNFDPLDIDNLSDHSDSSADTMIMMTTEEERKNQEKINHRSSPESATNKSNSNHTSPNDSPDDGYGTNSSTGTVSSPFSSSFGSSDFDHANSGGAKRVILPNGAIKPNSVRESWAVKRKQRMIEAQDNSVQEQLRELTIIEEEGGGSSGGNRGMRNENPINEIPEPIPMATGNANESEAPKSPLEKLSGELLEKWSDMDRNYRNYYGFDENEKKYSRTDSKVNYFQEKKINNMYGHDNYYRPQYGSEAALNQGQGQRSMSMRQPPTNQGILRDSKEKTSASKSSSSKRTEKPEKSGKEKESKGNKLFQILPNMFKPSSKKGNSESKDSKGHKPKRLLPVPVVVTETKPEVKHDNTEEYEQAEYLNIGDLPQYCLASVEQEEKLKKGQYVSLESLHKRPVFASSRDIKKLFSNHDQSFDSINSPGAQRHSFHAMPLSYRHRSGMMPGGDGDNDMRPRASSASASMRTQQMQNSVESRMALIARKNVQVMNQAHQARMEDNSSVGNTSFQSNSSNQRPSGSRTRLDSGSSGGDSKLSTLV
ncbi:hypothetical protein MAR_004785 [Mya arenaria]|uniref:Uncharacterized protein n=1 Tax=Mya arenaria TaxID=6604 RepID=A0ABY7EZ70_MYAAR|nr:hypothetical protein MAR_004785 [Mya arenaria]